MFRLSKELSDLILENIEECLEGALQPLVFMCNGSVDWNSVFWAALPGGPRTLS